MLCLCCWKRQHRPQCLRFFWPEPVCLSAGLRYLRLTRLPRHDCGPVPGVNRSAASCLCKVLRRALYQFERECHVHVSVKISDICGEMNPFGLSALEEVNLLFHLDGELNRDG